MQRVRLLDRLEAVLGLADDRQAVLLVDQRRDRAAEERLVVDEQDPDLRGDIEREDTAATSRLSPVAALVGVIRFSWPFDRARSCA